MANRSFNRKQALEKEIKELFADVAIGAAGAPTLTKGMGVASISRTSAGLYVLTLQDKYTRLMSVQVSQLVASAEDLKPQLVAETVTTNKTITFRMTAVGVETDPSSGSRLLISINLKNSSADRS